MLFDTENQALTWENPFSSGSDFGRLALPPPNQFHQITASGGYLLPYNTRFSGVLSFGRMTQDQAFLPYTINPAIQTAPLPRSSLDGEVDLTTVRLALASRPLPGLRLNGAYRFHQRDANTPQALYNYVGVDSVLSDPNSTTISDAPVPAINEPVSYHRNEVELGGAYRLTRITDLSLKYEYDDISRDFAEVDRTREHTGEIKFKLMPRTNWDASLRYARSARDNSTYVPSQIVNADGVVLVRENPLLRKYNLADRTRDKLGASLSYVFADTLTLGLQADYIQDDYSDSLVGLTSATEPTYTLDLSYVPLKDLSLYAFYTYQLIESEQAGASVDPTLTGPLPDWFAHEKDHFDTIGAGVKWANILGKFDVGADYVYASGRGELTLDTLPSVANSTPWPDVKTRQNTFKLYTRYHVRKDLSLKLSYWHEELRSSDWALDGVNPATTGTILLTGEDAANYDVDAVAVSVQFKF